jgi:hypothetical protein
MLPSCCCPDGQTLRHKSSHDVLWLACIGSRRVFIVLRTPALRSNARSPDVTRLLCGLNLTSLSDSLSAMRGETELHRHSAACVFILLDLRSCHRLHHRLECSQPDHVMGRPLVSVTDFPCVSCGRVSNGYRIPLLSEGHDTQ